MHRPRMPKHNRAVERSHKTDKMEFYQLMTDKDAVDLNEKLAECAPYEQPLEKIGKLS